MLWFSRGNDGESLKAPDGGAKPFAWLSLYAYPAGTSFCSCASSRAALHVGSLFLRNRQPANTPPLLLSPTGRATLRGPQMQNTLGGTPRPHAPERPFGTDYAVPKRGLNGAYRVSQTHLPPSPPIPRSGGGGSCPNHCSPYSCARQVPSAMGIRGKLTRKY